MKETTKSRSKKTKAPLPSSGGMSEKELFSFKVATEKKRLKSPENGTEKGSKPTQEALTFKGKVFMKRLSSFEKVIFFSALVLIVVSLFRGLATLLQCLPFLVFFYVLVKVFNAVLPQNQETTKAGIPTPKSIYECHQLWKGKEQCCLCGRDV